MLQDGKLYIGTSRNPDDSSVNKGEYLDLGYANRHGLITGATGTGKTVTLRADSRRGFLQCRRAGFLCRR